MLKPENSFKYIYSYLESGFMYSKYGIKVSNNINVFFKHLNNLRNYKVENPYDEEWNVFDIKLKIYISKMAKKVAKFVRGFTYFDVLEIDYQYIFRSDEYMELDEIYKFINIPYRYVNESNPRFDYLLFKNFTNVFLYEDSEKEYTAFDIQEGDFCQLMYFLLNKVNMYEVGYDNLDILDDKNDKEIFNNFCNFEDNIAAAYSFIKEECPTINSFYKNPKIFTINNYENEEKIRNSFLHMYKNINEYKTYEKRNDMFHIIGKYGELLFKEFLESANDNLHIIWLSNEVGDGFGYDFFVIDKSIDKSIAYEIKTTISKKFFDNFTLSANEYKKFMYENYENIPDFYGFYGTNMSELKIVNILVNPQGIIDMNIYEKDDYYDDHLIKRNYKSNQIEKIDIEKLNVKVKKL
ncbi:MAG: DUF3883 domain-containing protein [bacterium]|nr:DUF3883 domain-containing protein [bacterium]